MNVRRTAAALTSAAALSVTGVAMAAPATAAPVVAGGLVNVVVDIDDTLNNNEILTRNNISVGAALGVAATVCDVNVLAAQLGTDTAVCESDASNQQVRITQAQ